MTRQGRILLVQCATIRLHMSTKIKIILEKLATLRISSASVLVAIDGLAGSGKTTVANELVVLDPALRILHADELQRPQREGEWDTWTPQQGAVNFVLEAPLMDLLSALAAGQEAEYHAYDWSAHQPAPLTKVAPGGVLLVEGAYTLRPSLRHFFAYKIWVECDERVRMKRLRARPAPSPGWLDAWLAAERYYVANNRPAANADIQIQS